MLETQDNAVSKQEKREILIKEFTLILQRYKDESVNMAEFYRQINVYGKMVYFSDVKGQIIAIISVKGEEENIKIKL